MIIDRPTQDAIPALQALWAEAFGDPERFIHSFFAIGFSPRRCRCVLENGQPVSALYWFDCTADGQKVAYLYAIATAKKHRGKGHFHRLMADTLQHLQQEGYGGAVLVPAGEHLRQLYETLGFQNFGGITELLCQKSGETIPLSPITPDRYAQMRRVYLPRGSVVQEGAALKFLGSYMTLYAGNDLLFPVFLEDDHAYIPEYWGDPALLGTVLNTLGVSRGRVHTAGTNPFAMYYPLCDSFSVPTYFGLALD